MTKIYCDTADIKTIKKSIKLFNVDGVTTNPSIMRANGVKNYEKHCKEIIKITKTKPLSVEVFADNHQDIIEQAHKISSWSKHIYVKIPIINTKSHSLKETIKLLNSKGIKLNITAVFTYDQVMKIKSVINKKTPIIISIFCGRIADGGINPEILIRKTIKLFRSYKNVKILWASTREVYNFHQAKKSRCHIITMGPNFIEKLKSKKISMNEYTLQTVKQFYKDGKKSNFHI